VKAPHLTPQTLVGRRFAPDVFGDVKVALVGYCPPPSVLDRYSPERVTDQHFIHVSPDSVRLLTHQGRRFLSLAHVYGGPVSSSTVEELAYYGIEFVLAYGLAGGLGTGDLGMGDYYLAEDTLAADGATPHYTGARLLRADQDLINAALSLWPGQAPLRPVRVATGDAIYREYDALLEHYRLEGCDLVNLDCAHLYAAARINSTGRAMRTLQCGVISDVVPAGPDAESSSTLAAMLAGNSEGLNPLERTGDIVSFYIEALTPALLP
jgi:uridine phosphorylase